MPKYKYNAIDASGKNVKGVLNANNEVELQGLLKEQGLYLKSSALNEDKRTKRLKASVLADFSRQLGSLVGAGISMVRALTIIVEEEGLKPKHREVYAEILKTIKTGKSLSDAMEEMGDAFPPLMINMYRMAENSGSLEETSLRLAEHYEKENKRNKKIKSSMIYPRILAFLIVVVLVIIMGYVMPKFESLFAQMPTMPIATRCLFALSTLVTDYWWLLIIIIVALVATKKIISRQEKYKLFMGKIYVQLPGNIGNLFKTIYTARFARTLSTLYSCGISIVNALSIAGNTIGNEYILSQFDDFIASVRKGNALSVSINNVEGFSKKLSSSVKVGEESGELDKILLNMADNFDYEAEMAINKLVSYVEPAMIIIMAVIIAFIMFGVVMPIYNSYSYIA